MTRPAASVWNIADIEHLDTPQDVKQADGYVYIGRGAGGDAHLLNTTAPLLGWLGNPYTANNYGRQVAVEKFAQAFYDKLSEDEYFRTQVLARCAGNKLVCWCMPKNCHGEIIAGYLNASLQEVVDAVNGEYAAWKND